MAAALFNSMYSFAWDVRMDWGLGQPGAKRWGLRNSLLISPEDPWPYYVAVGLDFVLRLTWLARLADGWFRYRDLVLTLELIEVSVGKGRGRGGVSRSRKACVLGGCSKMGKRKLKIVRCAAVLLLASSSWTFHAATGTYLSVVGFIGGFVSMLSPRVEMPWSVGGSVIVRGRGGGMQCDAPYVPFSNAAGFSCVRRWCFFTTTGTF